MKSVIFILFNFLFFAIISQNEIKVTYYNLLNFPSSQPSRTDTLKKIIDYIQPDIFVVNELTSFNGGALIKNNVLNAGGSNNYQSALFFDGPDTDNLLFYNQNKMGLYSQQQIPTQLRDISEYVLYYKPLANQGDTNLIYFYSIHLKAGSSQTNEELRRQEAETFKQFLINNNRNNNLFVGGDFNFYDYLEPACQEILFGQSLDLVDPINQMASWHNNSSYANIHTQSTRSATGGFAGGAYGGMDDRFDIIFTSNDVISGSSGIQYISGSYVADGQDGNHFNQAINSGTNNQVSQEIADALFYMSDHLPVSLSFNISMPLSSHELINNQLAVNFIQSDKRLIINTMDSFESQIFVYDLSGRELFREELKNENQIEINLQSFSEGIYIANCIINGKRINRKFILSH
tara:strand:+ start:638 stop:1852 length:1215 start_codon:yes stop_codon:yes gene_type:complete